MSRPAPVAGWVVAVAGLAIALTAGGVLLSRLPGDAVAGDAPAATGAPMSGSDTDTAPPSSEPAIDGSAGAAMRAGAPATAARPPATPGSATSTEATKPFEFQAPAQASTATSCGFPSLANGAGAPLKVYAAGAYGGRRLGMHIDRSGHEAGRIDVAVNEPGARVALMLGSYDPVVWHVGWSRGTTIAAVLVGGYHHQVVTGLPEGVPVLVSTYDNQGPCGYFYVTAEKAGTLNPVARRAFGQPVDMVYPARDGRVVVGQALQGGAALSTAASAKPDDAFKVAERLAGGQAGLAHAVSQGWLREARPEDARAWLAARATVPAADVPPVAGGQPAGGIRMHNGYVVLRPFELPPGLHGAHSATFFVPKGVSRPTGDLGHSVLYDFNTLTCAGTLCDMR